MPVVSIIIPTKDRADLLQQTLDSLRAQAFADWEAIVIDDHSSDATVKQMQAASAADPRIRLRQLADKSGAPAARNLGVSEARGEFVIFLDSDDLLAPHCLQQRIEVMRDRADLDFTIFPCQLFRKTPGDGELLWNCRTEQDDLDRFLKMDVAWQTTSPIWRRASLAKFGAWDETVLSGQDWEFHIRAIVVGLKYEWFESTTFSPRVHAESPPRVDAGAKRDFTPDCFWRLADADRDSIGKQSFSAEHVRSRRDVIAKMQGVVENANRMTPQRREMFAGMYFQCAERVADRVSRKQGRQVWLDAYRAGVITAQQRLQGMQYFHLFRFPSLRAAQRRKLEKSWPANYFIRRSATYMKTPLHRGDLPAVSVVMSAYNASRYLRESIDSILAQTFGDWEFIIIDDGSTDETLSILREYESRDKRFRIISRPNTGLTRALNEGIAAARGEFIARMDADDVSLPQRFEKQIAHLRSHPDCVLLGAQIELIDPLGLRIALDHRKLNHDEIDAELLAGKGGSVVHPVCMMRADAVRKAGAYREHYNNSEDLDLFLRLAELGRVANLPELLLKYRRHPESVSHQKYENQWKLKKQIVAEAYERRGMKMPENWTFTPWKPKPVVTQLREWAWMALKAGKVNAARKHAMSVFKKAPFSGDSWRLMFCAIRGR